MYILCRLLVFLFQIGDILTAMGLAAHVQTFLEERVNGTILLQCDDSTLRDDLGVSSKVHRLRLLQVIEGRVSITTLLPTVEMHA